MGVSRELGCVSPACVPARLHLVHLVVLNPNTLAYVEGFFFLRMAVIPFYSGVGRGVVFFKRPADQPPSLSHSTGLGGLTKILRSHLMTYHDICTGRYSTGIILGVCPFLCGQDPPERTTIFLTISTLTSLSILGDCVRACVSMLPCAARLD